MDKLKASNRDHGQQLVTSGGPEKNMVLVTMISM